MASPHKRSGSKFPLRATSESPGALVTTDRWEILMARASSGPRGRQPGGTPPAGGLGPLVTVPLILANLAVVAIMIGLARPRLEYEVAVGYACLVPVTAEAVRQFFDTGQG